MSEFMPVLLGAALGLLRARYALTQRALLWSALTAATLATTLSGEWARAPYFFLADLALVGGGVLASTVAQRSWLSRRPGPEIVRRHSR